MFTNNALYQQDAGSGLGSQRPLAISCR